MIFLINELLDFSKIDAGMQKLTPVAFLLDDFMASNVKWTPKSGHGA